MLGIRPINILSFGKDSPTLRLENLNVLIGPNGSGKSNLIELIDLLRSTPLERALVQRKGGTLGDWVWRGDPSSPAGFDCELDYAIGQPHLRHHLLFTASREAREVRVHDERIENTTPIKGHMRRYYNYQQGSPRVNVPGKAVERVERHLAKESVDSASSIVAQRKDPETYPEITHLGEFYRDIRIYREWAFGRETVFRLPQKADLRSDRLEEDFSNLGLFLNRLRTTPKAKKAVLEGLRELYQEIDDFDVSVKGGSVQVFLTEGDFSLPATRLSDGTLRYLALLAILCDPDPPRLVCIEEPELGLHPDILPKLADRLIEASTRTQLIVTTHSDVLVDALSDHPSAVVVCEKRGGQTHLNRLDADKLQPWLKDYRLGRLWTSGQIGGTRW
jgi:predicted ATPase